MRSQIKRYTRPCPNISRNDSQRSMSCLWNYIRQKLRNDIEQGVTTEFNKYFNIKISQVPQIKSYCKNYCRPKPHHKYPFNKSNTSLRLLNKALYLTQSKLFVQNKSPCEKLRRNNNRNENQIQNCKSSSFTQGQRVVDNNSVSRLYNKISTKDSSVIKKEYPKNKSTKSSKVPSIKRLKIKPFSIYILIHKKSRPISQLIN